MMKTPPTEEVMEWIYGVSSCPGKRFVHYVGTKTPWKGFEDTGVPAVGTHGTTCSRLILELPGIVADWFVTTLIKTPGHAPVEPLASASILNQMELHRRRGSGHRANWRMRGAGTRRRSCSWRLSLLLVGYNHLAVGETKLGVEIMKLVVTA